LPASAVGSQTTMDQQAADDNNEESTSPVAPVATDSRISKQQVQDKKPDKKCVVLLLSTAHCFMTHCRVLLIPRSMPPPEVEEKGKKKAHSESPTQILEGIELDEVVSFERTTMLISYTLNYISMFHLATKPCYKDCSEIHDKCGEYKSSHFMRLNFFFFLVFVLLCIAYTMFTEVLAVMCCSLTPD